MPDTKPEGVSDEEWAALQAYRADRAPKRKGTLRGTDPESGAEYEIELTVEETAKLAARHLAGLFKDDGKPDDKDKKDDKRPSDIRSYFKSQQAKSG